MVRSMLRAVPFTLAIAALLLAVPADAHGRRERGHYGHYPHRGCGHGDVYYAPRHVTRHAYGYPVYRYDYAPEAYFCGPCNHHFRSYDALSYHVHRHHHVAVLALPSVILHGSIGAGVGWFFDF